MQFAASPVIVQPFAAPATPPIVVYSGPSSVKVPRALTNGSYTRVVALGGPQPLVLGHQQPMWATPNLAQTQNTIDKLSGLIAHGSPLRATVQRCFDEVRGNRDGLDIPGLLRLHQRISSVLGLPIDIFGDVQDEHIRFDFDGDGQINGKESYFLVKYMLREYRHRLGYHASVHDIPTCSPEQRGLQVGRVLGKGAQGTLKLATNTDGATVCLKCCDKSQMTPETIVELREEFLAMDQLNNDRVAKTFDMFQDAQFYYLLNEPYFGGDLSTCREKAEKQGVIVSEEWWRTIFRQCLEGLQYLHCHALMHCDIKEPNIMLKTDNYSHPEAVLIDLGLAQASASGRAKICGSPGYIPPETWDTSKWFPRGDVFSMGVTMLQLLIDQVPIIKEDPIYGPQALRGGIFSDKCQSIEEIAMRTRTWPPPLHRLPKSGSHSQLADVLARMLIKNRPLRLNAPQTLQQPWFTGSSAAIGGPTVVPAPRRGLIPTRVVVAGLPAQPAAAIATPMSLGNIDLPQAQPAVKVWPTV